MKQAKVLWLHWTEVSFEQFIIEILKSMIVFCAAYMNIHTSMVVVFRSLLAQFIATTPLIVFVCTMYVLPLLLLHNLSQLSFQGCNTWWQPRYGNATSLYICWCIVSSVQWVVKIHSPLLCFICTCNMVWEYLTFEDFHMWSFCAQIFWHKIDDMQKFSSRHYIHRKSFKCLIFVYYNVCD